MPYRWQRRHQPSSTSCTSASRHSPHSLTLNLPVFLPVPVEKINHNHYEIMTVSRNDTEQVLTLNEFLNYFAREDERLQRMLNSAPALRKHLINWLHDSDTREFAFIDRSSCCLDFQERRVAWCNGRLFLNFICLMAAFRFSAKKFKHEWRQMFSG